MTVRWSPKAAEDLAQIIAYVQKDSSEAAQRIAESIFARAEALSTFPQRGRVGRVRGTRELPLSPLPFVIVYRLHEDSLEISNILHGAQRWP